MCFIHSSYLNTCHTAVRDYVCRIASLGSRYCYQWPSGARKPGKCHCGGHLVSQPNPRRERIPDLVVMVNRQEGEGGSMFEDQNRKVGWPVYTSLSDATKLPELS